jgi:ribosomal protein S18 acetylase RimI-like enzyme
MINVRPYQDKDFENCLKICRDTSSLKRNEKWDKIVTTLYCEYYVKEEPQNCFVAVNENDEAIGYIICAEDYNKFKKDFKKKYFSKLRKLSIGQVIEKRLSFVFDKKIAKVYPAHLHIDIIDGYQRMGVGSRLMNTLVEHLKNKGVKGVHLGCGASNEKGCNFYKKYGFTLLRTAAGVNEFGLKLN